MKNYMKYWQRIVAILIISGLLSFPRAAQASGGGAYEQAPDHSGGAISDGPTVVVADDFQFNQPILIDNITWWGGYANGLYQFPVPSTDDFKIQLYADNGGQPGGLLQSFPVGNNAARTRTEDWVNPPEDDDFVGREEFRYSFALPTAFLAQANTRYWLSIVNQPSSDIWVWESSASILPPTLQRRIQSGPWEPFSDIFGNTFNLAFRLHASDQTPLPETPPPLYEQAPRHNGGGSSNGQTLRVADQFQFNLPTQITKITWWGGYGRDLSRHETVTDNFTIQLYADSGGQPGTLLQEFLVGNTAARLRTGGWLSRPFLRDDEDEEHFEGLHEYQYSYNLPTGSTGFLAEPSTRYWLVIMNRITDLSWDWEISTNSLYPGSLVSFTGGLWQSRDHDFAFQLHGSQAPLAIDIRPGIFPNEINMSSFGTVPVAILSNPSFDAPSTVNARTLSFGRTGNEQTRVRCDPFFNDVNRDGLPDLACTFNIQTTGFRVGDTIGTLKGKTTSGVLFTALGSVQIMP